MPTACSSPASRPRSSSRRRQGRDRGPRDRGRVGSDRDTRRSRRRLPGRHAAGGFHVGAEHLGGTGGPCRARAGSGPRPLCARSHALGRGGPDVALCRRPGHRSGADRRVVPARLRAAARPRDQGGAGDAARRGSPRPRDPPPQYERTSTSSRLWISLFLRTRCVHRSSRVCLRHRSRRCGQSGTRTSTTPPLRRSSPSPTDAWSGRRSDARSRSRACTRASRSPTTPPTWASPPYSRMPVAAGAGTALGATVLDWAATEGYTAVVTDWRATNLLSSRTWPKLGFRPTFLRLFRAIA